MVWTYDGCNASNWRSRQYRHLAVFVLQGEANAPDDDQDEIVDNDNDGNGTKDENGNRRFNSPLVEKSGLSLIRAGHLNNFLL